jgi:hypothetical protein
MPHWTRTRYPRVRNNAGRPWRRLRQPFRRCWARPPAPQRRPVAQSRRREGSLREGITGDNAAAGAAAAPGAKAPTLRPRPRVLRRIPPPLPTSARVAASARPGADAARARGGRLTGSGYNLSTQAPRRSPWGRGRRGVRAEAVGVHPRASRSGRRLTVRVSERRAVGPARPQEARRTRQAPSTATTGCGRRSEFQRALIQHTIRTYSS